MKCTSLSILLLLLTSCASWSNTDKALMTSFIALQGMDTYQTSQIDGITTREVNPIFAQEDDTANISLVIPMKIAAVGITYLLVRNSEKRTLWLTIANLIAGGGVVWNGRVLNDRREHEY